MPYAVQLDYFKRSGKWHAEGSYVSEHTSLNKIWAEVHRLRFSGKLPGLVEGNWHTDYIVSIDVPEHPHRHPHLII